MPRAHDTFGPTCPRTPKGCAEHHSFMMHAALHSLQRLLGESLTSYMRAGKCVNYFVRDCRSSLKMSPLLPRLKCPLAVVFSLVLLCSCFELRSAAVAARWRSLAKPASFPDMRSRSFRPATGRPPPCPLPVRSSGSAHATGKIASSSIGLLTCRAGWCYPFPVANVNAFERQPRQTE